MDALVLTTSVIRHCPPPVGGGADVGGGPNPDSTSPSLPCPDPGRRAGPEPGSAGQSPGGMEMRLKTAPWSSATVAIRPYGLSAGSRTIVPPYSTALTTDSSVPEVPK